MEDQTPVLPNLLYFFDHLRRHLHTEIQLLPPLLRYLRPGVAFGSLARQIHGRCQRRRNTARRRRRRHWWYQACCCPCPHGAEHTALIPLNWMPLQGKASIRICHLTLREVRASLSVFASSLCMLLSSSCMSSSSTFRLSSCHSHCKAFEHALQKKDQHDSDFRHQLQVNARAGFCGLTLFGSLCVSFVYVKISRCLGEKLQSHKLQQRRNAANS